MLPAVRHSGAIWLGASGNLTDNAGAEPEVQIEPVGAGAIATLDMPAAHYSRFYEGYSNSVLWPALHSRVDLIRCDPADFHSYREINAFMARSVLRIGRAPSAFWVHDYHFLTLGDELRKQGVTQPIGFFLHTPFPGRPVLTSVPQHRELVEAMLAYDLIGFQTENDVTNFSDYLEREFSLRCDGGVIAHGRGLTRLAAFPIGIDVDAFREQAASAAVHPDIANLLASLQGRKLVIGVDRLDYSKGLPSRFRAMDRLFELHPELRKTVHLLQIAVPTRDRIPAYRQLQDELSGLVGEINGRHADVDWTPIRYVKRSFPHAILAGFYRSADVGLVTPLQDGMNLVAKEYVAAQNPLDPGVLVLSEFAGAAKQLDAALLVNPHDIDAVEQAIRRALVMPQAERRRRWGALMTRLEDSALDMWFSDFVKALTSSSRRRQRRPFLLPSPSRTAMRPELRVIGGH